MSWLKEMFGVEKPIIALMHVRALPGEPRYKTDVGDMKEIVKIARNDLHALQAGGVDGILFSNEFGMPYLQKAETSSVACMSRIVGELMSEIKVPYGANIIADPYAALDFAVAIDASFIRGQITGTYASDGMGLVSRNVGETARHKMALGLKDLKMFYSLTPEGAVYLGKRDLASIAKSTVFNCKADAVCVSGACAGGETDKDKLAIVKEAVGPDVPVMNNTGLRYNNVETHLAIADGAFVGTAFKVDGKFENYVDPKEVEKLMNKVRAFRETL
ncbi:BtpA/SgcQ family protein [Feifania hominis]|uniref:BtpA/SgcQ family protein n=1 Tax=Feifania hominis TaxID=2763660 RepID=A0A926HTY8_9FIRM|nr:BtpA/SgcQ family protein [Feifania hominis]MBC8535773.1 BtpA/SgcQ family protein [Feifania hominis]